MRRIFLLLPISLLAFLASLQFVYDQRFVSAKKETAWSSAWLLTPFWQKSSFGFGNILADLYWLETIQRVPDWYGQNDFLPRSFDLVTTLDPKFEFPYLLSIWLLPRHGFMEETQRIAARGMRALPDNWEIPFQLGAQYHIVEKNTEEALRYVNIAAEKPGSPAVVKVVLATYQTNVGELVFAKALFTAIYETAQDERIKNIARVWVRRVELTEWIQQAVFLFRDQFGYFPVSVQELVERGIISEIPPELQGLDLSIDAEGNIRLRR